MTVWERICSHLNFFFGGGLILVFLVLFCQKLKKKKNPDIALVELKAGPLCRMAQGHHT